MDLPKSESWEVVELELKLISLLPLYSVVFRTECICLFIRLFSSLSSHIIASWHIFIIGPCIVLFLFYYGGRHPPRWYPVTPVS